MHFQKVGEVCAWCWLSLLPVYCPVRVIWCSWCRYCQSPEPCHFSPCETFDLLQSLSFSQPVYLCLSQSM